MASRNHTRFLSTARRRTRPVFDALERRELMAVVPTADEQYMLALVNRARANPAAEGQRLLALAQVDPAIHQATNGWDLNQFVQEISSFGPLPPLAFNTRLIEAARTEDARMLALNDQAHSPNGYLTNPTVATASDGKGYYDVTNASWATGENIYAFSANVNANSMSDYVNYLHAGFLIDWVNPDYGHLKNVMGPGPSTATATHFPYSEIGIGLLGNAVPTVPPASSPPNSGVNVGPTLVTQEFAWRSTGNPFLTGVVFNDGNQNGFYASGEGIGSVTIRAVGRAGQRAFSVNTWDSGGYSLALPSGTYDVTASGGTLAGSRTSTIVIGQDNVEWDLPIAPNLKADIPLTGDFDGDHKADVAVFHVDTTTWSYQRSSDASLISRQFGWPGVDVPVPARYDGGSTTEIAVFRPTTDEWFIAGPGGTRVVQFGWAGHDIPEPGDYDGDGKTDLAVYRPSTGEWFIQRSTDGGVTHIQFGWPGNDQPVPADYDGDGKTDIAVYRTSTAEWFVRQSSDGSTSVTQFGWPGNDQPLPGRYDGGTKAEIAVFRPSTAEWFIKRAADGGTTHQQFGWPGNDLPTSADYDGDGKTDVAVYRTSSGEWFLNQSTAGFVKIPFGQGGSMRTLAGTLSGNTPLPNSWINWTVPSPAAKSESGGPNLQDRTGTKARPRRVPQGPVLAFRLTLDHKTNHFAAFDGFR